MIQRIQSAYLFVAALLLAFVIVLNREWTETLNAIHEVLPPAVLALAMLGSLIGFIAVFLYKNRARQAKLVAVAQWVDLGLILVIVVGLGLLSFGTSEGVSASSMTYPVLLLPVASYVLFSLARRAVQKDIDIIRSMDRLR